MKFVSKRKFRGLIKINKEEVFVDSSDGQGLSIIIKALSPYIYKFTNNEDEQQEAFLAILEAIRYYNPARSKLMTFLFTVGRNRIFDYRKKKVVEKVEKKQHNSLDMLHDIVNLDF